MLAKLSRRDGLVISTGGGIILKESNRQILKENSNVIWLKASPGTIVQRVGLGKGRPLLKGKDVLQVVTELLGQREHLYSEVASYIVDTDNKSIDTIIEEIIEMMAREKKG
ncbi:MAG: shikimate kinase, partial [Bacillota bacterium]|nr:shikimate kinase [Bacillota bacterium]